MKQTTNKGNRLFYAALFFLVVWAIGFFGYNAGGMVHALLVIAIMALLLGLVRGRKLL